MNNIIDVDKTNALNILLFTMKILEQRECGFIKNIPQIFVYYAENSEYVQRQFEEIIKYTDCFREYINKNTLESIYCKHCFIYFCNKDNYDESVLSGRVGNIYLLTKECEKQQNEKFIQSLDYLLRMKIYV